MLAAAMSYLDHIARCNTASLIHCRPLLVDDRPVGILKQANVERLLNYPAVFRETPAGIAMMPLDPQTRTTALAEVVADLAGDGWITGIRHEHYTVRDSWNAKRLFAVERAACVHLGVRSWGVHLTGYVRRNDGLFIWIAQRGRNRPVAPGMLDNMVAGGLPDGLTPRQTMIKECGEEAGIPLILAERVQPAGMVSYLLETEKGFLPDELFCYDLELPEGFCPTPADGEVAGFELLPAGEVMARIDEGFSFKFNCPLVLIDFFIRHGLIGPEHPDYLALLHGLRGAPREMSALFEGVGLGQAK